MLCGLVRHRSDASVLSPLVAPCEPARLRLGSRHRGGNVRGRAQSQRPPPRSTLRQRTHRRGAAQGGATLGVASRPRGRAGVIDAALLAAAAREAGLAPVSAVVERIDRPGERAELDPELELYPASMIKVPIAVAALARVEAGALTLGQDVAVDERNLTANDAPSPMRAGYRATLGELIDLMLSRSDNVATNQLIDLLGREAITRHCRSIGLTRTAVRRKLSGSLPLIADPEANGRNAHPAGDAAALFAALDARRLPGALVVLGALARQYWTGKLPLGLRPGDRFAHKTGDTDEVSHDGGILTLADGRRYVVVLYTGATSPDTDPRFGTWMARVRAGLGENS
ncbi:serine hydrolase [bacterium]|nr:MAG: serine hydrolase [bacterium]